MRYCPWPRPWSPALAPLLLLAALLAGCGGEDEPAPPADHPPNHPAVADTTAPVATMTFPGPSARLTAPQLTVRGTAQDQSPITQVTVNGVPATSTDGFATWMAQVTLPAGESTLVVGTVDALGHTAPQAALATVTVGELLFAPLGLTVEATGTLVVADQGIFLGQTGNMASNQWYADTGLMRIDLVRGTQESLVREGTLLEPVNQFARAVAVEATGTLVVAHFEPFGLGSLGCCFGGSVTRVDPRTGVQTALPALTNPRAVAVEPTGTVVVLAKLQGLDRTLQVLRLDPVQETTTLVSGTSNATGQSRGSGLALVTPAGLAVEATGTLVVGDTGRLLRIDPVSGDRVVVSGEGIGRGPALVRPIALAVEATGTLVVIDTRGGADAAVLRVDPVTGAREPVTDATTGSGPLLDRPTAIAVEATGILVVTDAGLDALVRIDPRSGVRTLAFDGGHLGEGPVVHIPTNMAMETTGTLVVSDVGHQAILRIDPRTGDRSVLSGPTRGSGPAFSTPVALAIEATGTLVVVDWGVLNSAVIIVRVDPISGNRTVLADAITGSGPALRRPVAIAVEATRNLVVVDQPEPRFFYETSAILRVDPISGNRTVLADAMTGSGPLLDRPTAIVVEATGTLVVADLSQILRVDPVSGTRTLIADASPEGVSFTDIAVEATGDLLALGSSLAARVPLAAPIRVIRVNPVSGARSLVCDASTGSGPLPIRPAGLAVEATGTLVIVDTGPFRSASTELAEQPGLGAVLRVDPHSGDRAIISR